jgi:hypothetical protein
MNRERWRGIELSAVTDTARGNYLEILRVIGREVVLSVDRKPKRYVKRLAIALIEEIVSGHEFDGTPDFTG